jgi:hypothetical protein
MDRHFPWTMIRSTSDIHMTVCSAPRLFAAEHSRHYERQEVGHFVTTRHCIFGRLAAGGRTHACRPYGYVVRRDGSVLQTGIPEA